MGGLKIATIKGIPIRIHVTFLLVLPLLALGFARAFREAARLADVPAQRIAGAPLLWGVAVAVFLFASVLVHELAHSLYALRKGGRVRDIVLLMIGGVSQISEPPKGARAEAVMALVGPLVSLALGAVFYVLHLVVDASWFGLRFATFYLASLNLFLGAFNLLPAFPMDGGRILRAVLTRSQGPVRATRIAATVGKAFAVLFGAWGLLSTNMMLILLAVFVFVGANGETQAALVRTAIGKLRVRDLMRTDVAPLRWTATVAEAAARMVRERRLALVVEAMGEPRGVVTVAAIRSVPHERRATTPAVSIAVEAPALFADEDATRVLSRMAESDAGLWPVLADGRIVGAVGREDVRNALELAALADPPSAAAPRAWRAPVGAET
jgi:Zn-dependent protease